MLILNQTVMFEPVRMEWQNRTEEISWNKNTKEYRWKLSALKLPSLFRDFFFNWTDTDTRYFSQTHSSVVLFAILLLGRCSSATKRWAQRSRVHVYRNALERWSSSNNKRSHAPNGLRTFRVNESLGVAEFLPELVCVWQQQTPNRSEGALRSPNQCKVSNQALPFNRSPTLCKVFLDKMQIFTVP